MATAKTPAAAAPAAPSTPPAAPAAAPVSAKATAAPKKAAAPRKPVAARKAAPASKPAPAKKATPAGKPASAKKAAPAKKTPPVAKTVPLKVLALPKADKPKKPKLVRDSFTIPKNEYVVLDELKSRAAKLGHPAKKSEVLRAGLKALAVMSDSAFSACLNSVPTVKTGRPAKS